MLEEPNPHHHHISHSQSGLVQLVIGPHPVTESHGKDLMENRIHHPITPPVYEEISRFGYPKLQSIIVVEIIGYIVIPLIMTHRGIYVQISRIDGRKIHLLANLQWLISSLINIHHSLDSPGTQSDRDLISYCSKAIVMSIPPRNVIGSESWNGVDGMSRIDRVERHNRVQRGKVDRE